MPGEYSNDFHDYGDDPNGNPKYFHPQNDQYYPPKAPPLGNSTNKYTGYIPSIHFGDMVVGQSVPNFEGPAVKYDPVSGLALEVDINSADPWTPTYLPAAESRCLYLHDPLAYFSPYIEKVTADLYFDGPVVSNYTMASGTKPLDYVWGVGVILKDEQPAPNGYENEIDGQQMIRATCQFREHGQQLFFHGTDYSDPSTATQQVPLPQTPAEFHLSLTLWGEAMEIKGSTVTRWPSLAGTATLMIDSSPYTGRLTIPNDPATNLPYTHFDWIKAIGVSLVSAHNLLPYIRVNLKKFTLSVTPVHPGPASAKIRRVAMFAGQA